MKRSEMEIASTALLACPLCGCSNLRVELYGIECRSCGLWLGDGTRMRDRFGSLEKAWNSRHANKVISTKPQGGEEVKMNNDGEVLEALEDCVELLEMIRNCCHNQEGMVDAQIRDAKAAIAKARETKNKTTADEAGKE